MKFTDKRGREWEVFIDLYYFDCICIRLASDRDFYSNTSFHFDTDTQTKQFIELLKQAN